MFARTLRNGLLATVAAGALVMGMGTGPAAATPLPFQIDPDALTSSGGPYANVTATDINGISNALIQQTGASTQTETGYLKITGFTNNGVDVSNADLRLVPEGSIGTPGTSVYGLYLTFSGTVNGITGFGSGQTGTVGAGDYTFALYGDPTSDDTFSVGSANAAGGTAPSVTDTALNDVVLAVGSSLAGSVGFASVTGAPFFNVAANFIVCNGTAGQGVLGSMTVTGGDASGCGTFDARTYLVNPSPFYSIDMNSSISGSASNLGTPNGGPPANATLNGIVADINFQAVPEPATLSIFGAGLVALGAASRRRRKAAKGASAA